MIANTMTLKSYLKAIVLITITLIMAISGVLLVVVTQQTYIDGVSQRGIELAKVIASDEEIITAVKRSNQGQLVSLQATIEPLRSKTDASYIVITDANGVRLSHPLAERIGRPFSGADIWPTLETGVARTTFATGTLGPAIRNFVPIKDQGQVIGAISIGYLEQSVADLLFTYYIEAIIWLGVIYVLAIALTLSLLSKLKRTFLEYEPEEIVQRFKQHSVLLNGIREGIIAIDKEHKITAINPTASTWLNPELGQKEFIGTPLESLSRTLAQLIHEALLKRHKKVIKLGRHEFAATLYPLNETEHTGYLIVLNHEQDMSELEQELTRLTAYTHQLRAKTHEHNNKLNVVSGLLQAGKTNAAIEYLQQESDHHQSMLGNLVRTIENSPVAGMLLSKYNYANEHGITFTLDEDSQLKHYSQSVNDDLITLLGNFIDNAFYAAEANRAQHSPHITLFISDRTSYLMITVEDTGAGIDDDIADYIYDLGVSSKPQQTEHGVGLYLVSNIVRRYGGSLDWERSEQDTTVFSVYLDKRELKE
ncbi:sensor histidine kinase [Marinomonas ostreistagni]|uniref:sensor histidine kinase n=1 Tax=Marinomonas ostreistagni TaxID=359209 RepID=UPI0019517F79|nr:sensor histidine kinase [Marinomonas ostreistagni]MBM6550426.1 sensor histidine kinase [Marinomonas ostreistagni]